MGPTEFLAPCCFPGQGWVVASLGEAALFLASPGPLTPLPIPGCRWVCGKLGCHFHPLPKSKPAVTWLPPLPPTPLLPSPVPAVPPRPLGSGSSHHRRQLTREPP